MVVGAFVSDTRLAIGSSPARWATARVRTLAGIEARRSVLARFVVGTVVEILVAEQSTPTLIAVTLVRFGARSVFAARVSNAFVAISSGPARSASGNKEKTFVSGDVT